MTIHVAPLMAEYNRWMNQRLYAATATLPQEEIMRDRGAFFGSIFETLNHICAADTIWLHRFATEESQHGLRDAMAQLPRPTALRMQMGADLAALRAYRERLDEIIIDWAAGLTPEHLAGNLAYGNMAGKHNVKNFGALVQHFFNHQTHHRGQATTLLFQAGVDVGMTDLLAVIPGES